MDNSPGLHNKPRSVNNLRVNFSSGRNFDPLSDLCSKSERIHRVIRQQQPPGRPDANFCVIQPGSSLIKPGKKKMLKILHRQQQLLTAAHRKRINGWGSDSFSEKINLVSS